MYVLNSIAGGKGTPKMLFRIYQRKLIALSIC